MPCKMGTKKRSGFQETDAKSCESNKIPKTKHACIVEAHESTRKRMDSSEKSRASHRRERVQFSYSLQFGSQI